MHYLVFDIETAAEPDDVLETYFSFDATSVKNYRLLTAAFDPNDVKTGNMKDPAKIEAKIEAAREKFASDKAAVAENIETAKAEAWQDFKDKAALSPLTGQVLAIGSWVKTSDPKNAFSIHYVSTSGIMPVSEKDLIESFLETADAVLSDGGALVGHNIIGFDLPFLLRRGLRLGLRLSKPITDSLVQYRPKNLLDTQREWQMGNRMEKFVKLDQLAAFFGAPRKNGDGAEFGKKFFGTAEEKAEALAYLENDVRMTVAVAKAMKLI